MVKAQSNKNQQTNLASFAKRICSIIANNDSIIETIKGTEVAILLRRFHDIGQSGWWIWIFMIPTIGPFWLIYLLSHDLAELHAVGYVMSGLTEDDQFILPSRQPWLSWLLDKKTEATCL